MQATPSDAEISEAVAIQDQLAGTARRHLKSTPEYATARSEGRGREWLNAESSSMATYLYASMVERILEP